MNVFDNNMEEGCCKLSMQLSDYTQPIQCLPHYHDTVQKRLHLAFLNSQNCLTKIWFFSNHGHWINPISKSDQAHSIWHTNSIKLTCISQRFCLGVLHFNIISYRGKAYIDMHKNKNIHTYIYVYIHICIYTSLYIHIHIHIYININAHTYIYI